MDAALQGIEDKTTHSAHCAISLFGRVDASLARSGVFLKVGWRDALYRECKKVPSQSANVEAVERWNAYSGWQPRTLWMGEVLPGNGAASFWGSRCLCDLSCDIVILSEPIHKKVAWRKQWISSLLGLGRSHRNIWTWRLRNLNSPSVSGAWMNERRHLTCNASRARRC